MKCQQNLVEGHYCREPFAGSYVGVASPADSGGWVIGQAWWRVISKHDYMVTFWRGDVFPSVLVIFGPAVYSAGQWDPQCKRDC